MKISKTLYVADRHQWRAWLEKNHDTESEVWLIYYKKHTGRPRIPYDDAVEEALCFGWIDSVVQRIDDEKYAQKFTPRKDTSQWSALNKRRVAKLIKEGRMTKAGLAKINYPVADNGQEGPEPEGQREELAVPQYVTQALMANKKAWENFNNLAPSHRRNYIRWITDAKKEETRNRRLREAIEVRPDLWPVGDAAAS
jgi:uncharacterized protein YdeI (YjbR/CyaY-like superfamily)